MKDESNELINLIKTSWELHDTVESKYLNHPANKNDPNWAEKQRFLLADMAIHLLQTALDPNQLATQKLKNNLFSILTISDQYLPNLDLKTMAAQIYDQKSTNKEAN